MKKIISVTAMGISWGFTVLVFYMTVSAIINSDFFSNLTSAEFNLRRNYGTWIFCSVAYL